jgi:hypothetical protein
LSGHFCATSHIRSIQGSPWWRQGKIHMPKHLEDNKDGNMWILHSWKSQAAAWLVLVDAASELFCGASQIWNFVERLTLTRPAYRLAEMTTVSLISTSMYLSTSPWKRMPPIQVIRRVICLIRRNCHPNVSLRNFLAQNIYFRLGAKGTYIRRGV